MQLSTMMCYLLNVLEARTALPVKSVGLISMASTHVHDCCRQQLLAQYQNVSMRICRVVLMTLTDQRYWRSVRRSGSAGENRGAPCTHPCAAACLCVAAVLEKSDVCILCCVSFVLSLGYASDCSVFDV